MTEIIHHEPPYTVGYFVGSLAKESINRTLSKALIALAPAELEFREIGIGAPTRSPASRRASSAARSGRSARLSRSRA